MTRSRRTRSPLCSASRKVALIYGAAGTGKSTMVDHIANYFNDKSKLFLAHTNPAVDNLKRKVTRAGLDLPDDQQPHLPDGPDPEYDLLVIDECSTVSNADLLGVLEKTQFKLLVLVGDVYQIESIQFGNWFGIIRSFIPSHVGVRADDAVPNQERAPGLLGQGPEHRRRHRRGHRPQRLLDCARRRCSRRSDDEIILCLNYDGLYGINNINRFLQSSNPKPAVTWGPSTYKVGDPVFFSETERFRPVIYNNLKGRIVDIDRLAGRSSSTFELDRPVTEFDVDGTELEWVGDSTVRFSVYDYDTSDEDDDSLNTSVPFQVAYAVSIHKAQGLEYDSVKVVITDANEDDITHSIFYTAVTRAREELQIFWTPETQQAVINSLQARTPERMSRSCQPEGALRPFGASDVALGENWLLSSFMRPRRHDSYVGRSVPADPGGRQAAE